MNQATTKAQAASALLRQKSVLLLYRSLLKYANALPRWGDSPRETSLQFNAIKQIREAFRKHKDEQNPQVVAALIERGQREVQFTKRLINDDQKKTVRSAA